MDIGSRSVKTECKRKVSTNTAGAEVPPEKVELSLCPVGNGESFQQRSNDLIDVLGRELGTCWEGELVEEETDRAGVCL